MIVGFRRKRLSTTIISGVNKLLRPRMSKANEGQQSFENIIFF